ncbi:MraY family glycosyltransferase [Mangrovibacterium diazotrophicum]|uniref:UDP-N-acetylmuramyl pentapeptide phosphotransferase/UDP-N-acetylglucosamine-1-phosphate transferase n=1 Tax=Mangrovibacterium diazotrophicum TaxID=1261403 RepID=A0A419VYA4_9BACT|nr:MraY family glycosyltransferase [Mangrovibacterium diazotrophicum]RKD88192.1 UDP-N-acetylmuramyl pentapeptide phosphotransferase/UDP-N-acetylglucosamine-1-phosphate transferase [Mangrovibacterium diazotrophicum]
MLFSIIATALTGLLLTLITIPPIIKVSKEKDLFDEPNHRKLNKIVIPNLGGVAIFIGATLSSIIFFPPAIPHNIQYLFAGMVLMLFVGLKDDIIGSSARNKLFMQIIAALVLIFLGNLQFHNLYNLFAIGNIPVWIGVPLTLFFYLFIINAMNLIDGIDGLAAGISILFLSVMCFWFYHVEDQAHAVICAGFIGSLIGFLRFNLFSKKNKIFMGDTGSLILGVLIASLSILFLNPTNPLSGTVDLPHTPTMVLALLVVPTTDTLRVFYMRIRAGKSPFAPDMNHIHHVLIKSGISHRLSSLLLVFWSGAIFGLTMILHSIVPTTITFVFLISFTWFMVNIIYKRNSRMSKIRRMRLTVIKNRRKSRYHK